MMIEMTKKKNLFSLKNTVCTMEAQINFKISFYNNSNEKHVNLPLRKLVKKSATLLN